MCIYKAIEKSDTRDFYELTDNVIFHLKYLNGDHKQSEVVLILQTF